MDTELIRKYNVPGPRYTSYPTVPFWDVDLFSETIWSDRLIGPGVSFVGASGM